MAPVMEHTSVPPWALEPTIQSVDPQASQGLIISYGADDVARRWSDDLTRLGVESRVVELPAWSPGSPARTLDHGHRQLREELDHAVVGWRLLIAGALVDVLRARSCALAAGLLDDEIIVATTRTEILPVSCAHCDHITVQHTAIDEVISCSTCGESLVVYYHVSRRKGSFLGFKVDAELWEVPDEHP